MSLELPVPVRVIIGHQSSGKSDLINSLMQMNIAPINRNRMMSRITPDMFGQTLNFDNIDVQQISPLSPQRRQKLDRVRKRLF